jgi:hypothetical protein
MRANSLLHYIRSVFSFFLENSAGALGRSGQVDRGIPSWSSPAITRSFPLEPTKRDEEGRLSPARRREDGARKSELCDWLSGGFVAMGEKRFPMRCGEWEREPRPWERCYVLLEGGTNFILAGGRSQIEFEVGQARRNDMQ